jgi:hypothetical protein
MRVEILKNESDGKAKFELFERLNTGGARLSDQEVRNCVAVMLNEPFYNWLVDCSKFPPFERTINQTDDASSKQADQELALRFFAFRNVPYASNLNVNEYLDEALRILASDTNFDMISERDVFERTFRALDNAMGPDAFKRWDQKTFRGKFLMSVFEVVATGVSKNLAKIEQIPDGGSQFIIERCQALWNEPTFMRNNGAGVRGTTRLANLLPMAEAFFQ